MPTPPGIEGESPTGGHVTFLHGRQNLDSLAGTDGSPVAYRDVVYRRLWPGIDARITGAQQRPEVFLRDRAARRSAGDSSSLPGRRPHRGHQRGRTDDRRGRHTLSMAHRSHISRSTGARYRSTFASPCAAPTSASRSALTIARGRSSSIRPRVLDVSGSSGYDAGRAIAVTCPARRISSARREHPTSDHTGAYQTTFGAAQECPERRVRREDQRGRDGVRLRDVLGGAATTRRSASRLTPAARRTSPDTRSRTISVDEQRVQRRLGSRTTTAFSRSSTAAAPRSSTRRSSARTGRPIRRASPSTGTATRT